MKSRLAVRAATAVLCLAAVFAPSARAGAQVVDADSAFTLGDFAKARALYEQVLAADSLNERALSRLALLDSWDGLLDRSLQRFAKARQLDPANPDLMVGEARVLSWAGRTGAAEVLYDSALAQDTGRVDALVGRAQSVAWAGNLDRAEALYRSALAGHPDDAGLLVGLAQTLYWKGEAGLAKSYVDRARTVAPDDPTARQLERDLHAAVRPDVGTSFTGAGDSDNETFYAQDLWISGSLFRDVRGTLTTGWRHDGDPLRSDDSYGVSGLVTTALGPTVGARAGIGVRRLVSDSGDHLPLTVQAGLSWQPAQFAALSLSYGKAAFDETALLLEHGLTIDNLDAEVDLDPNPTMSLSGAAGTTWFSDGNRRLSGLVSALQGLGHGLSAGVLGRMMGYRTPNRGDGYFSPTLFTVLEARVIYNLRRGHWGLRADGGLGGQQIVAVSGTPAPWQSEWHLTGTLSRGWNGGEITLEGFYTNAAGASTVGAFRYHSVTLAVHQGI